MEALLPKGRTARIEEAGCAVVRTEAARTEAARTEAARTEAVRTEAARTEAEAARTEVAPHIGAGQNSALPCSWRREGHKHRLMVLASHHETGYGYVPGSSRRGRKKGDASSRSKHRRQSRTVSGSCLEWNSPSSAVGKGNQTTIQEPSGRNKHSSVSSCPGPGVPRSRRRQRTGKTKPCNRSYTLLEIHRIHKGHETSCSLAAAVRTQQQQPVMVGGSGSDKPREHRPEQDML